MSVKERKVRAAKCPQLTIFIQCFIYPCPTNEVRKGSIPTLPTHNPFRPFVVGEKLMDCLVYKNLRADLNYPKNACTLFLSSHKPLARLPIYSHPQSAQ